MGWFGYEMKRHHGMRVEVIGRLRMEGENMEQKNMEILRELGGKKGESDRVVIGGPTNSLVRHDKEGERGFGEERVVRIVRKGGGKEAWQVKNHLTDPVKISNVVKAEPVERMVDMVDKVKKTMVDRVTVVNVSKMLRFVRECCKSHMTDEDVWLLNGVRRDVKKEIVERLDDRDNGYYLNRKAKKLAAEILSTRLEELKKAPSGRAMG
jgi:hypothetical protein